MKLKKSQEIAKRMDDRKEDIIKKYYEGLSLRRIAREEGVSTQTISRYLERWEIREECKAELPFEKRVNPELLARMRENTCINNQKIKFYKLTKEVLEGRLYRRKIKSIN